MAQFASITWADLRRGTDMTKIKRETAMDFLGGLGDNLDTPPQHLAITEMMPDPEQPRKSFDDEALERLAAGIKSDGVLQPILLRESGGTPPYIITDGERRWRAAQLAGLESIPCYIRTDINVNRIRFVQAMANANRESLSDYDLAVVIKEQLEANPKLKQKEVAKQLGVSAATVTRLLAMLEPEYAELAQTGMIESASALAHFKNLDTASQAKLIEAAQAGEAITRDAVEACKAQTIANQAADEVRPETKAEAGDNENDAPNTVATPRTKPSDKGASSSTPSVKLSLKIEDVELLIPYFVDKEAEKLDLKMSHDTAIGLLENLGVPIPTDTSEYPASIKEGIKKVLSP